MGTPYQHRNGLQEVHQQLGHSQRLCSEHLEEDQPATKCADKISDNIRESQISKKLVTDGVSESYDRQKSQKKQPSTACRKHYIGVRI